MPLAEAEKPPVPCGLVARWKAWRAGRVERKQHVSKTNLLIDAELPAPISLPPDYAGLGMLGKDGLSLFHCGWMYVRDYPGAMWWRTRKSIPEDWGHKKEPV